MIVKKTMLFVVAGFLLFGVTMTMTKRNTPLTGTAGLEAYYGAIVDRVIAECRLRSRLRSGLIEQAAVINCFKATFFERCRTRLITELVRRKIGRNAFLVRYHLNRRFYEAVRAPAF